MTVTSSASPLPARWHAAHIHYHERDRSTLLVDAVRPVLNRLSPEIEAAYTLPHWRQGPHVRLNIRVDDRTWSDTVKPVLDGEIGGYLKAHPSTTVLDEAAELRSHLRLAQMENETGPLSPWWPNNTIQYPPYDSRLRALRGQQVLVDAVTDFYVDSNELFLEIAAYARSEADTKEMIGLTLMFTTAATATGGLPRNFGSFRAHGESLICTHSTPSVARDLFDSKYRANRDLVVDRMMAVVGSLEGDVTEPLPFVSEWAALLSAYRGRAQTLAAAGVMMDATELSALKELRTNRLYRHSEYLDLAFGNDEYIRRGMLNPELLAYRLLLNYTYLQITRLGIAPMARGLLCHLAANCVEDVYGVSAIGFMRKFTGEHPSRR